VKPKEKELKKGKDKCEEVIKELGTNSTTTQTQINELFNKIRNKLDEKQQELLNKLEEIEKFKKKELELQKEELKFGIESIGSCQMIENSIILSNNNKNDIQLISMKSLYESRLNYLSNNVWKIEPCHNSVIEFSINEKEEELIYSNILNIGIKNSNETSANQCLIPKNEEQETIIKNQELKLRNYNEITEPKLIFGEKENEYHQFYLSCGVTINSKGDIYVCGDNRIQIFDSEGKFISTFGSNGNGNGKFDHPKGIMINSKGNIIVHDRRNHRIQIFDSEGNFISTFGSYGDGIGQFKLPDGICIDKNDNIYVYESYNNQIQIFGSNGKFISKFESSYQFNSSVKMKLIQKETSLLVIVVMIKL